MRREAFGAKQHINLMNMPESARMLYLQKSMGDAHSSKREWAARELVGRNDDQTRKILNDILSQTNNPGRLEAARVLRQLNEK